MKLFEDDVCKYCVNDITWCQDSKQQQNDNDDDNELVKTQNGQPCAAIVHYGNLSADIWYKSAAILIGIPPKWSIRNTELCAEDIVEKCFINLSNK